MPLPGIEPGTFRFSDQGPSDLQADALPTELSRLDKFIKFLRWIDIPQTDILLTELHVSSIKRNNSNKYTL